MNLALLLESICAWSFWPDPDGCEPPHTLALLVEGSATAEIGGVMNLPSLRPVGVLGTRPLQAASSYG
jgi:hypothetical protein